MKALITGVHRDNAEGKCRTTKIILFLEPESEWEKLALELILDKKIKVIVEEATNV